MILKVSPKKMLLVDAFGAGLTFLLLALILGPFQKEFGMPVVVLRIFLIIAWVYFCYSLVSFFFRAQNHASLLKVIAFGNTFYSLLIAFFVIRYFEKLTVLGVCYFLAEICIILGLVIVELKLAYRSKPSEG